MSLSRSETRRRVGAGPLELQPGGSGLARSGTRRRVGDAVPPEQKKGYGVVRQGIKKLYPPPDSNRTTDIDIVFVPGLGAHPEHSWKSAEGNFNWASDKEGIARDFPNARVLLYMYESAWIGGLKVKQFIHNLAFTLLEGLASEREILGTSRPIVFIGHSMGGLVIAKAVCLAESRQNLFQNMFEDIAGCALFGTPFDGSEAASVAAMISHFGGNWDITVNSKLLELMRPGDDGLKELKHEFIRVVTKLSPKIALYGFWEEQPTKISDLSGVPEFIRKLQIPLPGKFANLVDKESAILGGNMDAMGLASSHRDLVKFDSSKDERYTLVRGPLKRLVHGAYLVAKGRRQSTRHIDREVVRNTMEVLDGARVSVKRKMITAASSSWVPNDVEYASWLAKLNGTLESPTMKRGDCLWIRGPEGRGKTSATLAALEGIEDMINASPIKTSVLLAYFFCDRTADYGTAEDLLKSLVRQLIDQQESLATHAKFLMRKKGKDDSKGQIQLTVENLWQVLQDILGDIDLSGARVYLVVNNLDTLQGESQSTKTLIDLLGLEIANMNNGRRSIVRWLITSGESWSIGQSLKGGSVRLIDLEDEKYEDQVQLELKKHAHEKVSDLVTRKHYSKALAYYAGSLIGRRAQNTQWIDITIVQLEQLSSQDSDLGIRLHLEVVPQKLDELLTTAWHRVFELNRGDVDEIKEVLRVLALTYEDPTEKELDLLTGLYSTEEQRTRLTQLVDMCNPLISLRRISKSESRVGFTQDIVKTHLFDNANKLLGLSDEDIKLQHGMLGFRAFSHIVKTFDFPETEMDHGGDESAREGQEVKPETETEEGVPNYDDNDDGDDENESDDGDEIVTRDSDQVTESDSESDSESDGWVSEDEDEDEEDPEAPLIKDMALAYAVKYWLLHASRATTDLAEALSTETEFWKTGSIIRRRWLTEHNRMTDSFKYYDRSGLSGLHVAASIGFRQLVVALMKNGHEEEKDQRDLRELTPLHLAAGFGNSDIIEELLNKGAQINDGIKEEYETPLHMAAAEGNVKAMDILLRRGADLNANSANYGGVINAAIESGNREAVKLLVERNVSLVAKEDTNKETGKQGDVGAQDESNNQKDDENDENEGEDELSDEEGESEDEDDEEVILSPLALAASRSDLTMLEFLLEEYSQKLPPKEFDTALIKAAQRGRMEAFKVLFDYSHTQEALQDSLNQAAEEDNWDIVALLLEKCRDLDCDDAFVDAAMGNDEQQEIQILEAMWEYANGQISPEKLDESLYCATDFENANTVQLLLKFGASADATGPEYGNALTAAAYDNTIHIVKTLLNYGANVNSPDGWALQTAAAEGHMEIVELLLNRGADVNAFTTHNDMQQGTALQAAVEAGNGVIVDLLLEHGANPDLGGGELTCPIIAAARKGEKDILERLIQAKAQIDILGGPYNATALTYAAMYLPQSSLLSLVDAGANIDLPDIEGDTPLILASRFGDAESVQFLLDRGANVLLTNHEGKNALQSAVEIGSEECVEVLVAHVSVLMEALRVAMESGDTAVTAVVRNVETRKQGLSYEEEDKPEIPIEDKVVFSQRSTHYQAAETQSSATLYETAGENVDHRKFADAPEAVTDMSNYGQGPRSRIQGEGLSWKDTADPNAWQYFASLSITGEETPPQPSANQPGPPWAQEDTPQRTHVYPASASGVVPIRRKPILSPKPDPFGNVPTTGTGPQFLNQPTSHSSEHTQNPFSQQIQPPFGAPIQHNTSSYQAPTPYRPQQSQRAEDKSRYPIPGEPHWNQYRANQPQQGQHQHIVSRGAGRVSLQQSGQQQHTSPPPQIRPYAPPSMDYGLQRSESYSGQPIQQLHKQPSKSFLGMKMPWSGDGQK